MSRDGKFNKYFKGTSKKISVKETVADKLQQIINSSESFDNMTDLLTFFIYNFDENKGLYNYQFNKFKDEFEILKEYSYKACVRADYFSEKSEAWKNKTKQMRREMSNMRAYIQRHIKKQRQKDGK